MSRVLTKACQLKADDEFRYDRVGYKLVATHHYNDVYTALWVIDSAGGMQTLSLPHQTIVEKTHKGIAITCEACEVKAHDYVQTSDDVFSEVVRVLCTPDNEVVLLFSNRSYVIVARDTKARVLR